jgi:hypothetical protein
VAGFRVSPESLNYTSLSYDNYPNETLARNADPFTLYPCWIVPLGFDKFYPGDVTGISVSVWADTGEVGSMGLMTADSGLANSSASKITAQGLNQSSLTLSTIFAIGAILCTSAFFISRKRVTNFAGSKKLRLKLWGVLFCVIMLLGMSTATVTATPHSSSRIYGALDGGGTPPSPAQSEQEKEAAGWVSYYIFNDFDSTGQYYVADECHEGTTLQHEQDDAYNDESNYQRATVFHFGHEAGAGTGYVDNSGTPIMYNDISSYTSAGKHNFAFIWVCDQAYAGSDYNYDDNTVQAWLHYPGLSSNGFGSGADNSGKCFIGFYGESPEIGNWGLEFKDYAYDDYPTSAPCDYFIKYSTTTHFCTAIV